MQSASAAANLKVVDCWWSWGELNDSLPQVDCSNNLPLTKAVVTITSCYHVTPEEEHDVWLNLKKKASKWTFELIFYIFRLKNKMQQSVETSKQVVPHEWFMQVSPTFTCFYISWIMKCQHSLMCFIFKTIFRLHPAHDAAWVSPPSSFPCGFILADVINLHVNKSQMDKVCSGPVGFEERSSSDEQSRQGIKKKCRLKWHQEQLSFLVCSQRCACTLQGPVWFFYSLLKGFLYHGSVNKMDCGPINGPYMAGVGLFFPQIALGVGEKRLHFSFSCWVLKLLMPNWSSLGTFLLFYMWEIKSRHKQRSHYQSF